MLNTITIMGRLTRDPELRYTQNQTAVASFALAVDRDYKKSDGEKETDFIQCVAWRSTADFVSKYFPKGAMAVVHGRLQIRPWVDRDGNKRQAAEVIVENIYFGESKKSAGQSGGQSADKPGGQSYGGGGFNEEVRPGEFGEMEPPDGELPF